MIVNTIVKKVLVIGIILLFLGTCLIPAIAQETQKPLPTSRGSWLYVGGSGPGNYTKIQDAIDNASDGDTVFIYDDSSPYEQDFTIDKSLLVRGENKTTTIIGGFNSIRSGNVVVSDLLFWAYGPSLLIDGFSDHIIENCIFNDHCASMYINESTTDIIRNCTFGDSWGGNPPIYIRNSDTIEISYCDFFNNSGSWVTANIIDIDSSGGITIHHCTFTNNSNVIGVHSSRGITIHHCNFTDNYGDGVWILASVVHLKSNNFVNNDGAGVIVISGLLGSCDMRGNWWGSPHGPSIYFITLYSWFIGDGGICIRNVDNADAVQLHGLTSVAPIIKLIRLIPWLSEPVADAGSNR